MYKFCFLLSMLVMLLLNSCGSNRDESPEAKSEGIKHDIITALNQEKAEVALGLAKQGQLEHPEDKDFLYYEAQALSLKANIDIYTLFPLVKMQLFDIAISEWQQANEFEDRRRQNTNLTLLGENQFDERYQKADKILAQVDALKAMTPEQREEVEHEFEIVNLQSYHYDYEKKYTCYISFSSKNKFTLKGKEFNSYFYRDFEKDCKSMDEAELIELLKAFVTADQLFEFTIFQLEDRAKRLLERKNQERFVKAGFALFDGLPILKKIPSSKPAALEQLKEALKKLESIRTDKSLDLRLKENTTKQIGLMGAYLITYSISSSLDLNQVNEPVDFICKVDAAAIVGNYPYLKLGFKSLLSVGLETEFYKKNKDNMEKIQEHMESAPDDLTDEEKARYIDDIEDFKEDNC